MKSCFEDPLLTGKGGDDVILAERMAFCGAFNSICTFGTGLPISELLAVHVLVGDAIIWQFCSQHLTVGGVWDS